MLDFQRQFRLLTEKRPFPWQERLYSEHFAKGVTPVACTLPTGLGKTSVIAIWLIALANGASVPRRLIYVVNRRTVVDQTTEEVVKYRRAIEENSELEELRAFLGETLRISTLRGQFADNREWSADPSRPAVICGTVDMIGSRLLFSGYGVGWKSKPLHAGFLGQDSLIVHDESHIEPAFQTLLEAIEKEQRQCKDFRPMRVMELTATPRSGGDVFELTREENAPPDELPPRPATDEEKANAPPIHHVWWRTHSAKRLVLHGVNDEKKEAVAQIVKKAIEHKDDLVQPAVLVFVRTVDAAGEVVKGLRAAKVNEKNILTLTGTMRGFERDRLATGSGVFARFKKDSPATPQFGTVYLVCTSAGEVGVDMSADHMVCDLSPLDSMAQRFGRVNRYGMGDARIDVVYPVKFDTKDKPFEAAREQTLVRLRELEKKGNANPAAVGELIRRLRGRL